MSKSFDEEISRVDRALEELDKIYRDKDNQISIISEIGGEGYEKYIQKIIDNVPDNELVYELIDSLTKEEINTPGIFDGDSYTLLYIASKNGLTDIVNILLDKRADPNICGSELNYSPLMISAVYKYNDIINILLENNADVNIVGHDGKTALNITCIWGDMDNVQLLLENNADIDRGAEKTSLSFAAANGHIEIVKLLLNNKASVNSVNGSISPIITTIGCCHKNHNQINYNEIIDILLEYNADVNEIDTNRDNVTPFTMACYTGNYDIVNQLLDNKADINHIYAGKLSIHLAMASNQSTNPIKIVDLLLNHPDNKIGINEVNDNICSDSLLVHAVRRGSVDMMKYLINNGADVNLVNSQNVSPLDIAYGIGDMEKINLLLENPNIISKNMKD